MLIIAILGEIKIIFSSNDFVNKEEALKHLHKDLSFSTEILIESITGYRSTLNTLDVAKLEVYDDID